FRFETVQAVLDDVQRRFGDSSAGAGGVRDPRYRSGYPFLFLSDADTVIGHKRRDLYGTSLLKDHKLPDFRNAMVGNPFGFVHYEFPPGTGKISGFAHCASPANGGFGWIVGVGVDHEDIYEPVRTFRDLLGVGALTVAGLVVVMAALFSARITRPLTRLVVHTEQVARGNLDV